MSQGMVNKFVNRIWDARWPKADHPGHPDFRVVAPIPGALSCLGGLSGRRAKQGFQHAIEFIEIDWLGQVLRRI